jgi:hypothetical protein
MYHSLVISLLITILTITLFISVQPSQKISASGITIYSPHWMNYERDLESQYSYFRYCGIFDSCFSNEIRIFPFVPLTTNAQDDESNIKHRDTESSMIPPRNTESSMIPPRNTESSIIPFQLPFP